MAASARNLVGGTGGRASLQKKRVRPIDRKEQKVIQIVIRVLISTGQENPSSSSRIFELLENGVSGILQKLVEILRVECAQNIFVPSYYQNPSQNPYEFLDQLREAMRQHTTLDPESDEGTQQLVNLFLGQSANDIRDLLEQLETKIIFKNGEISLEVKYEQYVQLLSLLLISKKIEVENEEEIIKKILKPLYALITEESRDLQWTTEATRAFNQLKKALMSAPALGLPDVSKPFFLFSHEKQGIALGVLAQDLGPYRRAVAYLSKQLDTAAKEWPGCLRAVAAVAVNIQEACKFTLGQKMTVLVSHTVSAVLQAKGGHWLSPQRFLKYQAILVEQDDVEIVVTNIVNPASFLSGSMGEPVIHDCLETIEATYSSRPDLKDTPLEDAESWFTDGSSYIISGKRHAGYAVTTSKEEDDLDLMDSPNCRLDGGTDNQSAKTDIMREIVRKEADLARLVERIERIGKMS
ncbi:hypothetical protein TURU_082063 [Turdus rufiventris]|nr:hypothetical protein TURU_082063 [Turdus rufiventris]